LVVMKNGKMEYSARYSFEGIRHLFPNATGKEESVQASKPETATPPANGPHQAAA